MKISSLTHAPVTVEIKTMFIYLIKGRQSSPAFLGLSDTGVERAIFLVYGLIIL